MEIERKYEMIDKHGDKHVFPSIGKMKDYAESNPHLFVDTNFTRTAQIKNVGYIDPDHYKNRKYEVFDVMRDTQGAQRHIGYLEGCVIKYMMRWDKKHDDPLMDLQKAKRYLEQLIKTIEEEQQHAMVSN